jgi:hypothetical protein
MVHTTLKDNQLAAIGAAAAPRPSDFLKILVRHLQYLAIISTMRVQWSAVLATSLFTGVGWIFAAASPEVVSIDCLFLQSTKGGGGIPLPIKRSLVYFVAPLAVMMIVLLSRGLVRVLAALPRCIRRQSHYRQQLFLRRHCDLYEALQVVCVAFLVVLFFFYPLLVRAALNIWACLSLDVQPKSMSESGTFSDPYPQYAVASAPHGYWLSDMHQPCFYGWHKTWAVSLGVPTTLILCVGVPLGLALLLLTKKDRREQNGWFRGCIGFVYCNYKQQMYFWEVVNLLQIQVMVAISVFAYSLGTYFSVVLLHLALVFARLLQYTCQPYALQSLNHTNLVSLGCLSWTSIAVLTLYKGDMPAPEEYSTVMGTFVAIVNAAFVVWCCYFAVRSTSGSFSDLLNKLKACWRRRAASARSSSVGTIALTQQAAGNPQCSAGQAGPSAE